MDISSVALPDGTRIPEEELYWEFILSSGPGGQKVNKSSSAVRLSWHPAASSVLREPLRGRLLCRAAARLSQGGYLSVTAQTERSQLNNRRVALQKLEALLATLGFEPKKRHPTRPTRGSVERRLSGKKHQSQNKELRKKIASHSRLDA